MYRYLLNGLITCLTLGGLLALVGGPICVGQTAIPGGQVGGVPTVSVRRTATLNKKWPIDPAWGGSTTVSAGETLAIASDGSSSIKQGDGSKYELEDGGLGHVNMHSGAYVFPVVDSQVPSHGISFAHKRIWRSDTNYNGPLGRGWDFWLDQKIIYEGSTVWGYHNGEGKKISISRDPGTGAGSSKRGDYYTIEVVNSSTLKLRGRYGLSATFVDLEGTYSRFRLTNIVDKNGIGLTLNYDNNHRLKTVVDSFAQVYTYSWYDTGRIERMVDNMGRIVRYRYNANDRLIQVRTHNPTTGTTAVANPMTVGAVVTKYGYSATDRLTSVTLPGDFGNGGAKVLALTYDTSVFQRVTQALVDGRAIAFNYNTTASTPYTEVTDRNGNVDRFEIVADSTVISSHIDYRNRSIVPGAPASVSTSHSTSPWGATLNTQYSGSGMYRARLYDYWTSDVLARGNLMEERLATSVGSDNSVWRFEYDSMNNITSATDPRAFPNGNVPTLWNGHVNLNNPQVQAHTTFFEYDARGNLIKQTSPSLSTKASIFAGETSAPIVTNITVHNTYGVPLHIEVSQEGNITKVIDMSYWPLSDPTGSSLSSVPTSSPDAPIGFLAKMVTSGQGDTIPGSSVKAPDQSVLLRYDRAGNRISEDDALGNTTRRTFNLANQLKSETTPAPFSITTTNTFNKNGYITKRSTPNLDEDGTAIPSQANLIEEADYTRLGRRTASRRLAASGKMLETRYFYDPNGNLILKANPSTASGDSASVESRVYDESDHLYSVTRGGLSAQFQALAAAWGLDFSAFSNSPKMSTVTYNRDHQGRMTQRTDGRGNSANYSYTELGWFKSKTDREGTLTLVQQHDNMGRALATETFDSNNNKLENVTSTYDELSRLVERSREFFAIDSTTGATTPLSPAAATKSWYFDSNNKVRKFGNARGIVVDKVHSATGLLVWRKDGIGNQTENHYDNNGQLTKTVRRDVDSTGGPDKVYTSTYTYDSNWRRTSQVDDLGNTISYGYNSQNLMSKRTDALGNIRSVSYDGLGRKIQVSSELRTGGVGSGSLEGTVKRVWEWDDNGTLHAHEDDNGKRTTHSYDSLNRLDKVVFNDSTEVQFDHDENGNRIWKKDQNGTEIDIVFDNENRRLSRTVSLFGPGVLPSVTSEEFQRDGKGRITQALSKNLGSTIASYQFDYDSLGQMISQDTAIDGLNFGSANREVDATGNVERFSYPGGGSDVIYGWNSQGRRLDSISLSASTGPLVDFSHWRNRKRQSVTYHAGIAANQSTITTRYGRDSVGRINTIQSDSTGFLTATDLVNRTYEYSARSQQETALDNEEQTGDIFKYDSLGRLISAHMDIDEQDLRSVPIPSGTLSDWVLDGVDNRISQTVGGASASFPQTPAGRNQYAGLTVGAQTIPFTYDANGNLTSDGSRTFAYDFRNRMTTITGPGGNVIASYTYDAFSRRVGKIVNGQQSYHVWVGSRLIEDCDNNGQVTWRYIYGVQGKNDVIAGEKADGSEREFYLKDLQGSVTDVISDTAAGQSVKMSMKYSAFGQIQALDGSGNTMAIPTDHTVFAYTGHITDPESGFHYMRARYMSPILGRFLNQDPMGYVDGLNLYGYVNHDPMNRFDPTGNGWFSSIVKAVAVTIAVVAVVVAVVVAAPVVAAGVAAGAAALGAGASAGAAVGAGVAAGAAAATAGTGAAITGAAAIAGASVAVAVVVGGDGDGDGGCDCGEGGESGGESEGTPEGEGTGESTGEGAGEGETEAPGSGEEGGEGEAEPQENEEPEEEPGEGEGEGEEPEETEEGNEGDPDGEEGGLEESEPPTQRGNVQPVGGQQPVGGN